MRGRSSSRGCTSGQTVPRGSQRLRRAGDVRRVSRPPEPGAEPGIACPRPRALDSHPPPLTFLWQRRGAGNPSTGSGSGSLPRRRPARSSPSLPRHAPASSQRLPRPGRRRCFPPYLEHGAAGPVAAPGGGIPSAPREVEKQDRMQGGSCGCSCGCLASPA